MGTSTRIQLRRGTQEQWRQVNPILSDGEPGIETDTGIMRIGDGKTAFLSLKPTYANAETDDYTILADNWTESVLNEGEESETSIWLQTIDVDLMSEEFNPHVALVMSNNVASALIQMEEYNKIYRGQSLDGGIKFFAFEKPETDLNIRIKRL